MLDAHHELGHWPGRQRPRDEKSSGPRSKILTSWAQVAASACIFLLGKEEVEASAYSASSARSP